MPTAVRRGVARAQLAAAMAKSLIRRSPGLGFDFRWRTDIERVVVKLNGEEREKIAAAEAVIAAARQGVARRGAGDGGAAPWRAWSEQGAPEKG